MDVTQAKIDDTDWRILAELQRDGRLSYKELGRRIHLSAEALEIAARHGCHPLRGVTTYEEV